MQVAKNGASPNCCTELFQIASLVGASTFDPEFLPEIPQLLVKLLPLERALLMVVGIDATISSDITSAYQAVEGKEPRELSISELDGAEYTETDKRTISMAQTISPDCRVQLQLRWKITPAGSSLDASETSKVIFSMLSRMVHVLHSWRTQPHQLGSEFGKLSDAQWRALLSMSSDWSEKQLADQLGISHHTLHSHVKVIYLKLSVQSRLEAVRRLQRAVRNYCVKAQQASSCDIRMPARNELPAVNIQVMSNALQAARKNLQGRVTLS